MQFVPIPNVVRAELVFTEAGQVVENVLHFTMPDSTVPDTGLELAEKLRDVWDTHIKAHCSNQVSLAKIIMTDMSTAGGYRLVFTTGLPISGGSDNIPMPNNVTIAIGLTTGGRGRSNRGRLFHVGLVQSQLTGNILNAAFLLILKAAYENYLDIPMTGGAASLGVASTIHLGVPRTTGQFVEVQSITIDPTLDSQRRRLPGRGR